MLEVTYQATLFRNAIRPAALKILPALPTPKDYRLSALAHIGRRHVRDHQEQSFASCGMLTPMQLVKEDSRPMWTLSCSSLRGNFLGKLNEKCLRPENTRNRLDKEELSTSVNVTASQWKVSLGGVANCNNHLIHGYSRHYVWS